jgi:oligosaccharide repeat unit polymerase
MQAHIRFKDYRQLIRPISPVIAFVLPWLAVLIGQQLALCKIIVQTYSTFYLIVIGNILSMLAIPFVIQTFFPQPLTSSIDYNNLPLTDRFKKLTWSLIIVYLLFQLFQIFYFKGFPLLWLLAGGGFHYMEFGINSLNGLLNATYLLATTMLFLIYLREGKLAQLITFFILLSIPILLISRQQLISIFLQVTCCLLLCRPKSFRKMAFCFFALLAAFVVIGNLRTGVESLTKILGPADYVPKSLYSLLWIYAYIVTPFNNLNAAIDSIKPIGSPYHEISSLVPSIFRASLFSEEVDTGYSLVHEQMTVSSFYLPLILDFGQLYAFLFMFAFQLILYLSYRRAMAPHSWIDLVEYSVLYMVMILSLFSNLLLYLPVIAQLLLIRLAKWQLLKKNGVLILANNRLN